MTVELWSTAVRYRARRDLRVGWRSLLMFSVVVGLGAGAMLACLAAARRTDSAFDRLRVATRSADAFLAPSCTEAGCEGATPIPAVDVEALPGVETAISLLTISGRFESGDGLVIQEDVRSGNVGLVASTDARWGRTLDVPLVVDGRPPSTGSLDEVSVTADLASESGLSIGDQLLVTVDFTGEGPPPGHDLELVVVGIVLHPLGVRPSSSEPHAPLVIGSVALADELVSRGMYAAAVAVAFEPGHGTDALDGTPWAGTALFDMDHQSDVIRDATDNDTFTLIAIALIGAIGSIAVLGPLVASTSRRMQRDQPQLRALGFTRRDFVCRASLHGLAIGSGAAVVAILVGVGASRWAPIAEARRVEPEPGSEFDALVLLPGAVTVMVLTLAVVIVGAWSINRPAGASSVRAPVVSKIIGGAQLGPTGALAMRIGFGRTGAARVGMASYMAILVGASGITGALTFLSGLEHLETTPRLVGADYDLYLFHDPQQEDFGAEWADGQVEALLARPEIVSASAGTFYPISAYRVGDTELRWLVTYGAGPKSAPPFTVTEGRAPTADDELLVHPVLRRQLGEVGDVVSLQAAVGPPDDSGQPTFVSQPYTVVGAGVTRVSSEFTSSAAITLDGLRRLVGPANASEVVAYVVTAKLGDGLEPAAVTESLISDKVVALGDVVEQPRHAARDVVGLDLDGVDRVPRALALLLAILGTCVMTITVAERARSWRPQIAVHRTLGQSSVHSAIAVVVAAVAILLACVLVALPLGIGAGHALWLRHAEGLGVVQEAPVPWLQLVVLLVAAIGTAIAVATIPAWRAARRPLGGALRVP